LDTNVEGKKRKRKPNWKYEEGELEDDVVEGRPKKKRPDAEDSALLTLPPPPPETLVKSPPPKSGTLDAFLSTPGKLYFRLVALLAGLYT